jgi:N-acetylglucosaminyl transferase component (Gpi1)
MVDDLTHNDVVIRQINASSILKRLLSERLTREHAESDFNFPLDFYGDAKYWLKASLPMKMTMIVFLVLQLPQVLILRAVLFFMAPLNKINVVIQMKKKLRSFDKARGYLHELMLPVKRDADSTTTSLMDQHLYHQAIFAKFQSTVTQLVVDLVLGCLVLIFVFKYPSLVVRMVSSVGKRLELDYVVQQIHWLFGYPAGIKPNINLQHFLGNFVLELISVWNHVTAALTKMKLLITIYVASVGTLGLSV